LHVLDIGQQICELSDHGVDDDVGGVGGVDDGIQHL